MRPIILANRVKREPPTRPAAPPEPRPSGILAAVRPAMQHVLQPFTFISRHRMPPQIALAFNSMVSALRELDIMLRELDAKQALCPHCNPQTDDNIAECGYPGCTVKTAHVHTESME